MKHFLTLLILTVIVQMGFSQTTKLQPGKTEAVDTKMRTAKTTNLRPINQLPQEGTYQIIVQDVTNQKVVPIIADEILYRINNERKQEEVVYLDINEYVRIKILPYSSVQSNDFKPLETYKHEN